MHEEPPPSPPPEPESSGSDIAFRAFIGFCVYVLCVVLAAASAAAGLVVVGLLILLAIYTGIKGIVRGFALGVFIGVGLTLLALGLCLAIVSKM